MKTEIETWVDIPEFPAYAISNMGRVMNIDTELIKVPTPNQQGIYSVNLINDHRQYRRSLAVLVANIFLPAPPDPEKFDTPIHLDGDKKNCKAENLSWRPRWFARMYHTQLQFPPIWGFNAIVENTNTGEVFSDIRDASTQYGLLERDIILSCHNRTPVFPTWHTFRVV